MGNQANRASNVSDLVATLRRYQADLAAFTDQDRRRHPEAHQSARITLSTNAVAALPVLLDALETRSAKQRSKPVALTEAQRDDIRDTLGAFHYETFRAGICYDRDDWPTNDDECRILDQSIDSVAVGEHYEGWASETVDKIIAILSGASIAPPIDATAPPGAP